MTTCAECGQQRVDILPRYAPVSAKDAAKPECSVLAGEHCQTCLGMRVAAVLVRRRDLCPTCEDKPALRYDPATDTWCPTCGGHGFVDECDADFKKRRHEAMRTAAGAHE